MGNDGQSFLLQFAQWLLSLKVRRMQKHPWRSHELTSVARLCPGCVGKIVFISIITGTATHLYTRCDCPQGEPVVVNHSKQADKATKPVSVALTKEQTSPAFCPVLFLPDTGLAVQVILTLTL